MTKQIPLTQGKVAIVDDDVYAVVMRDEWFCNGEGYAIRVRRGQSGETISMHRWLANTPKGLDTDHINGDRLDNRLDNLRHCTRKQNTQNKPIQKNNVSGYKGVAWKRDINRWIAQIKAEGKVHYLGAYLTAHDAAVAYNEAALKHYGEFAWLNVIE